MSETPDEPIDAQASPSAPSAASRDAKDPRRGPRWEIHLWIFIPLLFIVASLITDVRGMITERMIGAPLDVYLPLDLTELSGSLTLAGASTFSADGGIEVLVPFADLATSTIVMLVLARVLLVVGIAVCSAIAYGLLRQLATGQAFTQSVIRALSRLGWAAAATVLGYGAPLHLGANMVTRDLDIVGDATSGVRPLGALVVFSLVGIIEIVRQAFIAGKKAQEELEGLI